MCSALGTGPGRMEKARWSYFWMADRFADLTSSRTAISCLSAQLFSRSSPIPTHRVHVECCHAFICRFATLRTSLSPMGVCRIQQPACWISLGVDGSSRGQKDPRISAAYYR